MKHTSIGFICLVLLSTLIYSQGKVVSNKFYSSSLDRDIPVKIYKPENFSDTGDPNRVYIYLHGAGGSVSFGYDVFMKPMLDRLIADKEIDPIVVVFPVFRFVTAYGKSIPYDGHWYADSERNGLYESAITVDLLAWLEESYHTSANRNERAIGGFSMGAAGACQIAVRHNDKFCCCVSHDGPNSPKAWIYDLQGLLSETPGPPYEFDVSYGIYSGFWFGVASAYSPNLIKS